MLAAAIVADFESPFIIISCFIFGFGGMISSFGVLLSSVTAAPKLIVDFSSSWIILFIFIAILLAVGIFFALKYRKAIITVLSVNKKDVSKSQPTAYTVKPQKEQRQAEKAPDEEQLPLHTLLAVDEAHANSLISDSLAKSLISEERDFVETSGVKKCIVNIDTLSDAFSSGDVIDINSMKEKGVIPKDARWVKVLGGGVIDKPLTVTANSFSLTAAKMIALTGGKAIKKKTVKKKNK